MPPAVGPWPRPTRAARRRLRRGVTRPRRQTRRPFRQLADQGLRVVDGRAPDRQRDRRRSTAATTADRSAPPTRRDAGPVGDGRRPARPPGGGRGRPTGRRLHPGRRRAAADPGGCSADRSSAIGSAAVETGPTTPGPCSGPRRSRAPDRRRRSRLSRIRTAPFSAR